MEAKEKAAAIKRMVKYCLFIGLCGGVSQFMLPPEKNVWLRIAIGIVIGMMILGRRLPKAFSAYNKAVNPFEE